MQTDKKSPSRVGTILSESFTHIGFLSLLDEYRIKKLWHRAVGPFISKKAHPLRLIGDILYVGVGSSPWMTELKFQEKTIISRINTLIGKNRIRRIVLKPMAIDTPSTDNRKYEKEREITPQERLFIEKAVLPIEEKGLRELVKRVMEKSKKRTL